ELSLERNAERFREAGRSEEIVRLLEVGCSNNVLERRAIVASVEHVECLEIQAELEPVAELEILGHSQVHLNERVASFGTWRKLVLVVAVSGFPVVGHAIFVYVANARRENTIRSRRRSLENRSELEAPGQTEYARDHKTVSLVGVSRSVVG